MHWFWRAVIAVGAGLLCYGLCWLVMMGIWKLPQNFRPLQVVITVGSVASLVIIPVVIYGILTRRFHPKKHFLDGETRCRKCGYILRGITEPRCSECGERI